MTGVSPAAASFPPQVTVDNPVEGATWTGGHETDFHVTGHGDSDSGTYVTAVGVLVESIDGNPKSYPGSASFPQPGTNGAGSHQNFDIQVFPDLNGKYKVSVAARGKTCFVTCSNEQTGGTVIRTITVVVPPKTPTGAKSSLSGSVATVQWDANNTEGDLLGYIVEVAGGSNDFKCMATMPVDPEAPSTYKTTVDLKALPSGEYRWRIKAVRRSNPDSTLGTCSKLGSGIGSNYANTKLTWDNPTPPTTSTTSTTVKGGGSTGGTTSTTRGGARTPAGGSGGPSAPKTPNLSALGGLNAGTGLSNTGRRAAEADPGFNDFLPFPAGSDPTEDGGSATPDSALAAAPDENSGRTTLLFVAAGLLATVLSMHVLWLKAQVDRAPLEPLAPQDLPLN
jgi:hypothetical protein